MYNNTNYSATEVTEHTEKHAQEPFRSGAIFLRKHVLDKSVLS